MPRTPLPRPGVPSSDETLGDDGAPAAIALIATLVSLAGVVHLVGHGAPLGVVLPAAGLAGVVAVAMVVRVDETGGAIAAWVDVPPVRATLLRLVLPGLAVAGVVAASLLASGSPPPAPQVQGVAATLSIVGPAIALGVVRRPRG